MSNHTPMPWYFIRHSDGRVSIQNRENGAGILIVGNVSADDAAYIVKAVNEYSKLQDKIEAPDGKEYRSWVYQLVAEKDKLVEALQAISGGSFQDAGIFAVKGEWQKFANSLQAIATHAIEQTAGAA